MSDRTRKRVLPPRRQPTYDSKIHDSPDRGEGPTIDAFGREWPPIPDSALPRDIVLSRLKWVTQRAPGQWTACCPSHDDSQPSLSIRERPDGTLLVHCFSGIRCSAESICEALGLSVAHLFPTAYALRCRGSTHQSSEITRVTPKLDPDVPPDPHMAVLTNRFRRTPDRRDRVRELARVLGVSVESLDALRVGWSDRGQGRWTVPERDHRRRVVGISYRHPDGTRTSAKGGRRGLIMPRDISFPDGSTLYVAEGTSDTAALMSAGRVAIGRPAAQTSALVRVWLSRLISERCIDRPVIVVGDRDDAGIASARDLAEWLASECGRSVRWALPRHGHKDVRGQWVAEGTVKLLLQGGSK